VYLKEGTYHTRLFRGPTLLVSGAAAAPVPDMASTTMEADSTAGAPKKQRRGDMRGAQHADATDPTTVRNDQQTCV
jgi:hypothetical protein